MSDTREQFESECRNLIGSLQALERELADSPHEEIASSRLHSLRLKLVNSLLNDASNDDRLRIAHSIKAELELLLRSDVVSPALERAQNHVFVFQDARFSEVRDGKVQLGGSA